MCRPHFKQISGVLLDGHRGGVGKTSNWSPRCCAVVHVKLTLGLPVRAFQYRTVRYRTPPYVSLIM